MADPSYLIPEPPPGEVRTLVNPPSSGGGVIPAAVATTVMALIVVCLRMYTRLALGRGLLGVDDCEYYRGQLDTPQLEIH